jgi:hypothetical protein
MNANSMRRGTALLRQPGDIDWGAVAVWLLCFGLVVYLGMKGGGYDPLVHDPVGIAAWWIALGGVAVGALPRGRNKRVAWVALGLLAAFVLWTALSLSWTESISRTSADLARVAGYLGIFALAILTRASREADRLIGAVVAGIVVIAGVALFSRLHPSWFPEADQTANFIADSRERLSYPIDYWNGLGALIAIGIPLALYLAGSARSVLFRALAAAAIPAMALTIFFTLSRGSVAAAGVAVAVFLAIAPDRLPKLLTLLVSGAGGALLIALAAHKEALQHGLESDTAHHQGNEMLAIVFVVCALVGILQVAVALALADERRPGWTRVPGRRAATATAAALVLVLIAAVAVDAPGRASDGWHEFKRGGGPGAGTGRFNSVAGQSRYQFWRAALHENESKPLTGTGSGTFELWWARNATTDESVRDTHSLYLQTLGELGIVGLAILVAFLGTVFFAGGRAALRSRQSGRTALAAALAGVVAFCLTATVDWMWQIPVLAVVLLLLASILVTAEQPAADSGVVVALRPPLRIGFVAVALAAIAAIAIPLASTALLRQSESDAHNGDLGAAFAAAQKAQNVQPDAAAPRLQEALVLEEQGNLPAAAAAAHAATERESTNWRNWLVLSRIEAERGRAAAAVSSYREARSLNPRSELFAR